MNQRSSHTTPFCIDNHWQDERSHRTMHTWHKARTQRLHSPIDCPCVSVTDDEWEKIESGTSVKNVVNLPDRGELLFDDLALVLKNMVIDKDNDGQYVLYTGCKLAEDGSLTEIDDE